MQGAGRWFAGKCSFLRDCTQVFDKEVKVQQNRLLGQNRGMVKAFLATFSGSTLPPKLIAAPGS
jgi:hypothetical protein